MSSRLILLGAACASLFAATAQAGVFVDFNGGASDVTTNFSGNGQNLPGWSASNGLGGSGAIDVTASDFGNFQGVQATGTFESFATPGAQLQVSAFFRIDVAPTNNPTDARLLDLYIGDDSSTSFTASGGLINAHYGVRLNTVTNNTTYRLVERNDNGNGQQAGGNFSLTLGDWHKMTLVFTNNGGTIIDLTATIDNYGPTGAAFVSNVITATESHVNAELLGDSSLYSGFRIPRGDNLSALDNFEFIAVPEPASLSLLALGGLAALRRRRA